MNPGKAITSVLGAILDGIEVGVETDLDNQQQAIQSREWNRALRARMLQATDARVRGARDAGLLRMRGSRLEGQQRLAYAMGNVDANSGTAAQTISSSRLYSELDADTARNNARREALGHDTAVLQLEEYGRAQAVARKSRDVGRALRLGGSFLGMAGGLVDSVYGGK
jgi:hypothetical protein